MPDAKTEYTVNFSSLDGGLNIRDLDYRLKNDESPEMMNMMWRNGVLNGRDGQVWVSDAEIGTTYAMYERLFHGHLFSHIGDKMYRMNPFEDSAWTEVLSGVPEIRGTFFQYDSRLYYKTKGAYVQIGYDSIAGTFSAANVDGYVPVIVINASPSNGSGTLYQPENRIQAKKLVKYNAAENVTVYRLPVSPVDAVTSVVVDGEELTEGVDYTVDLISGAVTFATAPPVTDPKTNNTVWITYAKANTDAYNSIMDCRYAATYGGTGALCVVLGGCEAQPNAYFWNSNNIAMDASYFPFSQYQLAGSSDDMITGFGKQQSYLVIFKHSSVGRTVMKTETVDERLTIDLPYVPINDKIGCDLPWTIQLIDNNLVWCNTEQGVHTLKDSSSAYENNIECISGKVNGSKEKLALLHDVRSGGVVASADDTRRYWLCANGHVWLWDYENTEYRNPSWYYFTNIHGVAFASELDDLWNVDAGGRVTHFERTAFADYGEGIHKRYRFATQFFGGYDRLKNVNSVIITLRSDTNSETELTYITDYGRRKDLTNLSTRVWRLVPRNLAQRSLSAIGFGAAFRRRPMCRRIRHFTMTLDNNGVGEDLAIVSAQVFYNYQGRLR